MALTTTVHSASVDGATALMDELSLHTADPGGDGSNEVTGGSYARQALTWAGASSGSDSASATVPVPGGTTVSHVGFWDGTMFSGGVAVDTAETWGSDGSAEVTATVTAT